MNPGSLDRRVIFTRHVATGPAKNSYAPIAAAWASYTRGSGREAVESGRLGDIEVGLLRIRDGATARDLTIDDRVMVAGVEFRLQAISLADRRTGLVDITVSTSRLSGR